MSVLEVMGGYLLGLFLGGILGFMVGRRLCPHVIRTSRIARLSGRWNHRLRQIFRSSSPGTEGKGIPRKAAGVPAVQEETTGTTNLPPQVKSPDRVVEDLRSEVPLTAPLSQPRQRPRWIARWMRRRTVEAEEFIVRDSTGLRRAKLGMSADGWVRLRLFDEAGGRCATLGVAPDGNVRLRFYDQTGTPRVALRVLDDGPGDVSILDQDEKIVWQAP